MRQTLKKGFTIAVSVMTAFWSVGVAAFAPIAAAADTGAAAVAEGDLVKGSLAGVYYVGADGKRYVASNFNTYDSWYPDFSMVQTLTDSELAAIPLGGNMTYRPGFKLIKIQTDPKVYMVGANASLHPIPDEATALALFGADWATMVQDVPDVFFTNYVVSTDAVAATLGVGGKLPTGTVVMQGSTYYLVGETSVHMATGPTERLGAVVMAADAAALTSLVGTVPSTPTSMNIDDIARPDRSGSLESGTGGSTPGTSGVSLNVLKEATNIAMAVSGGTAMNMGETEIEVCSGTSASGAMEVTGLNVSAATGTVTFNDMILFMMLGGYLYEVSGTQAGDTVAELAATDQNAMVNGCTAGTVYHAAGLTGGTINLVATDLFTTSGTAGASTTSVNKSLASRSANPVNAADLADLAFSSPTPAGGPTLQTDGTKQKLFGVQATVSNNDMLIPDMVFKVNGTISTSDCELRINGGISSTDYNWNGKYLAFALPADKQLFDEGTDSWETWCNIDGEAGQTVTPQIVWPAPGFHLYDNVRVMATGVSGKEMVAPALTRLTSSVPAALTLAGASSVTESINVTNVVGQNDEKTSGATNTIVAAFRVKIRGSKGTLATVTYVAAGTHAAKGFANCQIKIGMRVDKASINLTSVDMADYSLSNYGSQNNVVGTNVVVTANKQLQIGDHLFLWECDAVTAGAAYADGDVANINMVVGVTNLNFDIGTTGNFPTGTVSGTTITLRLLTALAVASDATARNLVANGNSQVVGVFTITGPTQEGVDISSIAITFVAALSGPTGCTTATIADGAGVELATSQSLLQAGGTLTFSVTLNVAMNTEFQLKVVCLQASSAVTPATPAAATVLATISGTGDSSAQSFTTSPATNGALVNIVASGTVTVAQGTTDANQIIGPDEVLKVLTETVTTSIHEAQELVTLNLLLTATTAAASEVTKVTIKAEGFTVAGTAAAAETTICERTVTGVSPVTTTCNFSTGDVTLGAGSTGTLTYYVTGNSVGNVGLTAATSTIAATLAGTATDIMLQGVQSQVGIVPANVVVTGRVVTPAYSTVRVVNQSPTSRFESGKIGMEQALMDVIVGGSNIVLTNVGGPCYTNDTTNVCETEDTTDLVVDNTSISAGVAITATPTFVHASLTQLLTVGTHSVKVLYNDNAITNSTCSTSGDNLQLGTDDFRFTTNAGGQTFAAAQTPLVADFSSASGNEIKHVSTTCA